MDQLSSALDTLVHPLDRLLAPAQQHHSTSSAEQELTQLPESASAGGSGSDTISPPASDYVTCSEGASDSSASLPKSSPPSLASDFTKLALDADTVASQPKIHIVTETKCGVRAGGPPVGITKTVINKTTGDILRYAGVEFHSELTDFEGKDRRTSNARVVVETTAADAGKSFLCFTYTNRVVFGTDNVPDEWLSHIKDELRSLAAYPRSGTAKIEMSRDPKSFEGKELIKYLNDPSPNRFLAPLKYSPSNISSKSPRNTPQDLKFVETWNELHWAYGKEGKLTVHPGQLTAPAVHCFGSAEEAKLKLIHGRYAEHLWEQKLSLDISIHAFKAAFVKTPSNKVLAYIRLVDKGPLPRLNDKMTLKVSFNALGKTDGKLLMKSFSALGMLTINELDIRCTMVLLLKSVPKVPKRLLEKAIPLSQAQARPEDLEFMSVDVQLKDYEQARLQVEAVNTFFSFSSPGYRKFWQVFMGISSHGLKSSNFLTEKFGVTPQQIDAVIEKVRMKMAAAGMVLNTEQSEILNRLGRTHGGWRLIRGPPGTGKSTMISILACALLLFSRLPGTHSNNQPDIGVLLVAPSNGAASKLYGSMTVVMNLLGIDQKPLRLFRKYHELEHGLACFDPDDSQGEGSSPRLSDDDSGEILEDWANDWYARQLEAEDRRIMDDPSNGVMAAVIEASKDGNLHQTGGANDAMPPVNTKRAVQFEHYRAAKAALPRLRLHREKQIKVMSLEDRTKLHKDMFDVATQLVGTRKVVVSTADNARSFLARNGIFRDTNSWNIFFDEQTLATDVSTISVAAGTVNGERIRKEFAGKTPLDSIHLIGDEKQGVPLIQSHQDQANLFGPQMELSTFERLVKVGVPVEVLREQHRMAPIIREIPSQRCYDGDLRDAPEVQARILTEGERSILKSILKCPVPNFELMPGGENQQLRHLLLDVPETNEGREEETASRLNLTNIRVTIELVKYIVLSGLVTPREIVVLTFYNAQKKEYIRALSQVEGELGLKKGDFDDCVETSDSFQGRERKCVILDFVVSHYAYETGMGNVSNERKMNVACTRARDYFFVVARLDILESRNIPPGKLEYGLELLKRLNERKALVDIAKVRALARLAVEKAKMMKASK